MRSHGSNDGASFASTRRSARSAERVRALEDGPDGGDQRAPAAQDLRAQTAPLVRGRHEGGEGREGIWGGAVAAAAYRAVHEPGHRGWRVVWDGVPDERNGVPDCDHGVRRHAEQDLELRELIEECIPVSYVAVQQEGGPTLYRQSAHLLLKVGPRFEGESFEGHP